MKEGINVDKELNWEKPHVVRFLFYCTATELSPESQRLALTKYDMVCHTDLVVLLESSSFRSGDIRPYDPPPLNTDPPHHLPAWSILAFDICPGS